MTEPPRLPPSGSGAHVAAAAAASTARTLASTAAALSERLQVWMQVELRPSRAITAELIETQLRPVGSTTAWSQGIQAQLASPRLTNPLQVPAAGDRSATGSTLPAALRAEVVATSPALVLRLISTHTDRSTPIPSQTTAASSREWLGQQFRQHWPESRPLAATLDRILGQLASDIGAQSSATTLTAQATSIQRAVDGLIGQLATVTELTDPEQLAAAVSRSGLWLEAVLAQAAITPMQSNEPARDLKAQLLVLAERIRLQGARLPSTPTGTQPTVGQRADSPPSPPNLPSQTGTQPERSGTSAGAEPRLGATPEPAGARAGRVAAAESNLPPATDNEQPEAARAAEQSNPRTANLARDVEGMLKQVVTKQLQSLDSPAGQTQWLLELPFRTPSGLQALEADIRREQARDSREQETWSMRLRLDLPKLGPLNILLTLRNDRLNASLQSSDAEGAEQIRQHLSELRARLEAREIEIASLHAGHRPLDRPAPPFTDPLVREQA